MDKQDDLNPKKTYKDSGVDLDAAGEAIKLIKKPVFSTFNKNVLNDLSSYAGLFLFEKDRFKEPVSLFLSFRQGGTAMASLAHYTRTRKRLKRHKQGKARKQKIRKLGSTPSFPLDPP